MRITQEQYDAAARAVHGQLIETTGRRRHEKTYKKAAGKALGIRSVYPGRWAEVIASGERLRLFRRDEHTGSYPFLVALTLDAVDLVETFVAEVTTDEDTSDDPTVEMRIQGPRPPSVSPPIGFYCALCLKPPLLHWAIPLPEDDTDFYVDDDGAWKCCGCARIGFRESWGGVKRWMNESETVQARREILARLALHLRLSVAGDE